MYEIDTSEIESKFYDLCRLCASYDNVKISVFSDEGKRRQLRKKIQSFLPFKIEENDGLPKSLCYKCVYNLETTYDFRYKCIQVNRNLEKHLHKKEREIQSARTVGCGQTNRIHPEVSIFAIPPQRDENKITEESSGVAPLESDGDSPNPLDFLEVGVNLDENSSIRSKHNLAENKKSYAWKADKRWLSVEHKPLNSDSVNDSKANATKYSDLTQDENSSRRKSCNPRKIARESEDADDTAYLTTNASPSTANLTAISFSKSRNDAEGAVGKKSSDVEVGVAAEDETDSSEQKIFTCLLCEKNFDLRSSLDKHFSSTHGIEPYEVASQAANATTLVTQSLTKQVLDERNDEEELESMMEQETVIFCEVCRREFQDRASLWLHMVHAHREEASVSCGICLKICCDNITLIEHVNTAHSGDKAVIQRRYSCQVCGRQHDSRQKLLKHATLHTLIDNQGQTIQPEEMVSLNNAFAPRECTICHKKFFNEEKLNHHTQNFHNDANENTLLSPSAVYKCELCPAAHATRMDRWWHMYHSHNGDARVTCERNGCRKIFVSPALKDEHFRAHHETQGNFTNTCEICGKLWESRTVFYKHMMNVHPKCLPTICGICMKIFSNVPELRTHVRDDHPPLEECGGICCDVCGRPYAERSKMLRHRRVHNVTDGVPSATSTLKKKDDLVCAFCPHLIFDKYEDVADHRRSVHQLFVCDLCPKFYNGNNHLWKHVSKQHKGDPSVTCNLCLRTSASRAHLERHKLKYHSDPLEKLIHKQTTSGNANANANANANGSGSGSGNGNGNGNILAATSSVSHICNLCGKIFRIRSLLKKHSKSCKGAKPLVAKVQPVNGVFPCAKCGKVFELQNVLYKHMKNSHMQHRCEACPSVEVEGASATSSSFDTKKDLLQHIREQHSNDHELACDVVGCGKVLRLKADLKKHKLEHVRGHFTYICEICGDMFSNRKKLRKHLQTYHKGDVKFLCSICVAIHQSIEELTAHVHSAHPIVLHRPYTCQICGKCWSVSCKVVEHINKVHGKEYKPCKICWKVFTDERLFEQHTNDHPPIDEKPSVTAPPPPPPPPPLLSSSSPPPSPPLPPPPPPPTSLSPQPPMPHESLKNVVDSKNRSANKSGLPQELLALGVSFETDGSLKRSLEDDSLSGDDNNGGDGSGCSSKRLRRKYKCVWCKETFRSTDELNDHKEAQHASRESVVERVQRDESTSEAAATSIVAVEEKHESNKFERWTSIRRIACDCCEKIWNSKKQLWQHLIRSHAYESQYACGICLQVCRDYFDLFYHLDSQHSAIINDDGANRFSCFVCGHYHNSQTKLDKHFLLHKNPPVRCEYTCQHCRKVFKSAAFYREHARLHHVAPPEIKTKPYSEFSGFSINHILATKDDRRRNAVLAAAAAAASTAASTATTTTTDQIVQGSVVNQSSERSTNYFDEGAYDVKYEEKLEDNDEDLVEELDEGEDSESNDDIDLATNNQSSDDGNAFKGYDTCPPPNYSTIPTPQNDRTADTTTAVLSSECNNSVVAPAAAVLNGNKDSAHATRKFHKQIAKFENDVKPFS